MKGTCNLAKFLTIHRVCLSKFEQKTSYHVAIPDTHVDTSDDIHLLDKDECDPCYAVQSKFPWTPDEIHTSLSK